MKSGNKLKIISINFSIFSNFVLGRLKAEGRLLIRETALPLIRRWRTWQGFLGSRRCSLGVRPSGRTRVASGWRTTRIARRPPCGGSQSSKTKTVLFYKLHNAGRWLLLSWQKGRFRHQRTRPRTFGIALTTIHVHASCSLGKLSLCIWDIGKQWLCDVMLYHKFTCFVHCLISVSPFSQMMMGLPSLAVTCTDQLSRWKVTERSTRGPNYTL